MARENNLLYIAGILTNALPYLASVLIFTFVILLFKKNDEDERFVIKSIQEFSSLVSTRSMESDWYKNTSRKLLKNGVAFHFWKNINPGSYLILKIILSVAGFMIGTMFQTIYGIIFMILLPLLPEILIHYMNKTDNEKMLPDIKVVYSSLAMQIKAGIYVSDAISECHRSVNEPRLKQAFLELAGDIVMQADIFKSLESFQAKFDNRYIDSLCITILQAIESGQAVELLNDIGEQIKDMEVILLEKKKNSIDRKFTFYQLGILCAMLIVVIYACVAYMLESAIKF